MILRGLSRNNALHNLLKLITIIKYNNIKCSQVINALLSAIHLKDKTKLGG